MFSWEHSIDSSYTECHVANKETRVPSYFLKKVNPITKFPRILRSVVNKSGSSQQWNKYSARHRFLQDWNRGTEKRMTHVYRQVNLGTWSQVGQHCLLAFLQYFLECMVHCLQIIPLYKLD
jgi:hypothetical protein